MSRIHDLLVAMAFGLMVGGACTYAAVDWNSMPTFGQTVPYAVPVTYGPCELCGNDRDVLRLVGEQVREVCLCNECITCLRVRIKMIHRNEEEEAKCEPDLRRTQVTSTAASASVRSVATHLKATPKSAAKTAVTTSVGRSTSTVAASTVTPPHRSSSTPTQRKRQ